MTTQTSGFQLQLGPTLEEAVFEKFRALIYEKTGIHMRDGKQILIANRLRKRLAARGLTTYEQYYSLLLDGRHGSEMTDFVDSVTTNETYFYREGHHFEALAASVLPELFRKRSRVRIWSAGCSSGEEAYTLRIVADRAARAAGATPPEIVGTDISTTVIERARAGIYRDRALRLVPPEILDSCFIDLGGGSFQVRPEIRARVDYRVHNLFADPAPWETTDVIFCRNVMIYFDKATQARLVDGIFARALHPDGYLFIGHSESLSGFTTRFVYTASMKAPVYRKRAEERS
jgi:chemotaxis protein methyltransferase CheR